MRAGGVGDGARRGRAPRQPAPPMAQRFAVGSDGPLRRLGRRRAVVLVARLALPLVGLALLLAWPDADGRWEHHPSHFWLVLGHRLVNLGLGLLASDAARRRGDARLVLVALAFMSARRLPRPARARDARRAARAARTRASSSRRRSGSLLAARLRGALGLDLGARADTLSCAGSALLRYGARPAPARLGRVLARRAAAARPTRSRRESADAIGCSCSPSPGSRSTASPPGATSRLYRAPALAGAARASSPPRSCSPRRCSRSRSAATGTRRGGSGTC